MKPDEPRRHWISAGSDAPPPPAAADAETQKDVHALLASVYDLGVAGLAILHHEWLTRRVSALRVRFVLQLAHPFLGDIAPHELAARAALDQSSYGSVRPDDVHTALAGEIVTLARVLPQALALHPSDGYQALVEVLDTASATLVAGEISLGASIEHALADIGRLQPTPAHEFVSLQRRIAARLARGQYLGPRLPTRLEWALGLTVLASERDPNVALVVHLRAACQMADQLDHARSSLEKPQMRSDDADQRYAK